jgi:hypothetical protein
MVNGIENNEDSKRWPTKATKNTPITWLAPADNFALSRPNSSLPCLGLSREGGFWPDWGEKEGRYKWRGSFEGRKEGRKDGRKDGRKEGRKVAKEQTNGG